MADEDEDIGHGRSSGLAEDVDLSDETQDFRFLDKLTYSDRNSTPPRVASPKKLTSLPA